MSRQKNKRGDSKMESNDSPEIPDWGETSDNPDLLLGDMTEGFGKPQSIYGYILTHSRLK